MCLIAVIKRAGGRHRVSISARDLLFVRVKSLKPAFLPEEVGLFFCTCSPRTFQRLASDANGDEAETDESLPYFLWKPCISLIAPVCGGLWSSSNTLHVSFLAFGLCHSHSSEQRCLTLFREPGRIWKNTFFVWVYRTCIQCLLTQEGGRDGVESLGTTDEAL